MARDKKTKSTSPVILNSRSVLPTAEVGDVSTQASKNSNAWFSEVNVRPIASFAMVAVGFFFLAYIVLSDNPHADKYRDQAWGAILTLIVGGGAYLFGSTRRDSNSGE